MPTQEQLMDDLTAMAASWSDTPSLSNDEGEGWRCGELRRALADRFGVHVDIVSNGTADSTHYRVAAVPPVSWD